MWSGLAPQTLKNLVNWMEHFTRRYAQYKFWIEEEEPKVIWLSGLHIPESYITALVQTTCRAKGWALDKSTLYTVVTKHKKADEIKKRLD
jgi:dynein heavy chain